MTLMLAQLAPGDYSTEKDLYRSLRDRAEECLIIQVERQEIVAVGDEWNRIIIEAKILAVESSINRLSVGDTVKIQYHTLGKANTNTAKFLQMPALVTGQIYPAFLNRDKESGLYKAAVYQKSFGIRP